MKYNFDQVINRKDTNSLKWDLRQVDLPMWVADMDFEVAPCIQESIEQIVNNKVYGYSMIDLDFYKSIQRWWLTRHGIGFDTGMMQFVSGLMPAIKVLIDRFSAPGEKVVIQTPVYHLFAQTVQEAGRIVSCNQLMYQDNEYFVDFIDLEKRLSDPLTTILLLCNPQNPTGTIWDKDTLARIGKLCEKYGVLVISDEIHCDLMEPGFSYIPFSRVNDTCRNVSVTLVSASKAFNIAGLQTGCVITPNPSLNSKVKTALQKTYISDPNIFACQASIAAFKDGQAWLDECNAYIAENRNVVIEFFKESLPELIVTKGNASYLLWIDCRNVTKDTGDMCDLLLKKEGLFLSKGKQFGPGGEAFIRMNIACPRQMLLESLLALRTGLHSRSMRKYLQANEE